MQQGFQELSKEEKEELVQRRMDNMRRKNEELLKRYAEIEADKKNADLFSSSAIKDSPKKPVPADDGRNVPERQRILRPPQQPKPLRRPHTMPPEKPPQNKVQPEERRPQRLSADDHPPPDPGFRFLADRMREQDENEGADGPHAEDGDWGEPRGRSQRHRRNYGGRDFENVGPTMRHQRDLEREYPESPPRNLAMRMTGRQRREYEQWKCDRERIDQERMQRHTTASGEFKREWDHHKEEQEDLPPQSGRKYEDRSHSYGSRVFSRGGQRGRGNGTSRGPRRGGRQETPRDRTESSSSARSDLSSEPEFFCDRPRNNRRAVPAREQAPDLPPQKFDAADDQHLGREQPTILRNYEHGEEVPRRYPGDYEQSDRNNYERRNYNRGPEQRNYNPSLNARNQDRNVDFDRRGRGRGRGGWEQRGGPRERRGRDWGGRGGRDSHDRMMGGRGSQPRRRGGERRFADRRELATRMSSSATDSEDTIPMADNAARMNAFTERERRGNGGRRTFAEERGPMRQLPSPAPVESVPSTTSCYEAWDAVVQSPGGVEWGADEGEGDGSRGEDFKGSGDDDSHDEGWEDAPSHPDDDDDAEQMGEDEALKRSEEPGMTFSGKSSLQQSDEPEVTTDAVDSMQTVGQEEIGCAEGDEEYEGTESSDEHSQDQRAEVQDAEDHQADAEAREVSEDRVAAAVNVDKTETEQKDLGSVDAHGDSKEDAGIVECASHFRADVCGKEIESVQHVEGSASLLARGKQEAEPSPTDTPEITSIETSVSDNTHSDATMDAKDAAIPDEGTPTSADDRDGKQLHFESSLRNCADHLPKLEPSETSSSPLQTDGTDESPAQDSVSTDSAEEIKDVPEEKQAAPEHTVEDKQNI